MLSFSQHYKFPLMYIFVEMCSEFFITSLKIEKILWKLLIKVFEKITHRLDYFSWGTKIGFLKSYLSSRCSPLRGYLQNLFFLVGISCRSLTPHLQDLIINDGNNSDYRYVMQHFSNVTINHQGSLSFQWLW